ncbi:hypothetical protein SETIT_4G232800v2 [Setaria italica]|uniref:Uncharacterized protein n=1 Tax=Setaria italica TaxID=4555 RepID=A0A368QXC1_SETIT|nr:hypothetical protein SETIT_4G232800v2 [Setaria italica]
MTKRKSVPGKSTGFPFSARLIHLSWHGHGVNQVQRILSSKMPHVMLPCKWRLRRNYGTRVHQLLASCILYFPGNRTKYVSRYSIAASLLLCLRIIQNGGTTKKKKKIQSPCTFNMLYGSSEKQQQNLHTKE